jgi:hypothetical protein
MGKVISNSSEEERRRPPCRHTAAQNDEYNNPSYTDSSTPSIMQQTLYGAPNEIIYLACISFGATRQKRRTNATTPCRVDYHAHVTQTRFDSDGDDRDQYFVARKFYSLHGSVLIPNATKSSVSHLNAVLPLLMLLPRTQLGVDWQSNIHPEILEIMCIDNVSAVPEKAGSLRYSCCCLRTLFWSKLRESPTLFASSLVHHFNRATSCMELAKLARERRGRWAIMNSRSPGEAWPSPTSFAEDCVA